MSTEFTLFGGVEIETVAGFPIPKYGALLEDEKEWLRKKEFADTDQLSIVISIARRIAEDNEISQAEALKIIQTTNEMDENLKFIIPYLEDFQKLRMPAFAKLRRQTEYAEILLRSRLDPNWIFENIDNFRTHRRINLNLDQVMKIRQVPEEEWLTNPDRIEVIQHIIRRLPDTYLDALATFFSNELSHWINIHPDVSISESDPDFLEESSKHSTSSGSKSTKNGSSSERRTGKSKPPGFQTPALKEDDLVGSQPG